MDDEVAKYLEDKKVKEFVQDLMQVVLVQQPSDPRAFLVDYIKQKYALNTDPQQ